MGSTQENKLMTQPKAGIVYAMSNPAMPGIVKIDKTSREIDCRFNDLHSTGVPLPFECDYAALVEDEGKIERVFHNAFAPYRVNTRREFFKIDLIQQLPRRCVQEIRREWWLLMKNSA